MPPTPSTPEQRYGWLKFGLIWGLLMILFLGVFEPMYNKEPITTGTLLHEALLWIPGGILLGLIQHLITSRRKKKE